jgi:hypothetical protein
MLPEDDGHGATMMADWVLWLMVEKNDCQEKATMLECSGVWWLMVVV